MQKIKRALKLKDKSKFNELYRSRNQWAPLVDIKSLMEISREHNGPEVAVLEQWALELETPPFTLKQFEADWSVLNSSNLGIPYFIMSEQDNWELNSDRDGTTYLMKAAQMKDDELVRKLIRNCNFNEKKTVANILQRDKKGYHALDYAVMAGDLWTVMEFLEWVDIEEVEDSSKYAKKSFFTKLNRLLLIIGLIYAEDRKWHKKTHHILSENIIQLVEEYDSYYDIEDLVKPDAHGYTGLMLVADIIPSRNTTITSTLLHYTPKCQIEAVDDDGMSALDYAVVRKNTQAVEEIQNMIGN